MKNTLRYFLALGFAAALALPPAMAQDLGKLANKTKEERLKVKMARSVRVWTNDNMPKRPAGEGPTAAAGMSVAPVEEVSPPHVGEIPPPGQEATESVDASTIDALRGQIKQAKQSLAGLEERQRLAEDELGLLEVQQASELAPETQATLAPKISEKKQAISTRRQDMQKIKKEIEKLQEDLKSAGGTLEEKK